MDVLSGKFTFIGLENYQRMIESGYFFQTILNTLLIWIMSIIPQLTIAFVLSLILSNKWFRGKFLLRNLYYFPNLVTPVTIGLLFGALFSYPGGAVNNIISTFGLEAVDFQNNPMLARIVIAIAICWKNFGFNIIYFTAGINSISEEVMEAAEVDGAGWLQKLLYITIPQVRKAAGMILFLAVINSFKVFREAYIVAGSYPNDRIYLLQHLFNHWFLNLDVQKMCAAAVLLTIVIGIFLIPFVIRAGGDE